MRLRRKLMTIVGCGYIEEHRTEELGFCRIGKLVER